MRSCLPGKGNTSVGRFGLDAIRTSDFSIQTASSRTDELNKYYGVASSAHPTERSAFGRYLAQSRLRKGNFLGEPGPDRLTPRVVAHLIVCDRVRREARGHAVEIVHVDSTHEAKDGRRQVQFLFHHAQPPCAAARCDRRRGRSSVWSGCTRTFEPR